MTILTVLVLWELLAGLQISSYLSFAAIPKPSQLFDAVSSMIGSYNFYVDAYVSLRRITFGFAIATVIGVSIGVLCARSMFANSTIGSIVEVCRPIPAIVLAPIFVLILPSSEHSIIAVTATASFFPISINTRDAILRLNPDWDEALLIMGASWIQRIRFVVLPGALPGVLTGMSLGVSASWVCLISAEMLSGRFGLGYRTWQAFTIVDYPGMFAGVLAICVIGGGTTSIFSLVSRRSTLWRA